MAFDPLDGSSILGANFAVGSIFGIWPGSTLVAQKAGDQVAAAYAIYGPKTILVIALASKLSGASRAYLIVQQRDARQRPVARRASAVLHSELPSCMLHSENICMPFMYKQGCPIAVGLAGQPPVMLQSFSYVHA